MASLSSPRSWFARAFLAGSVALLLAACGGGGGDSTGPNPPPPPPPPPPSVASVTVAPSSASLTVPQTVQLTATPRDAQGNAMTTTVTWSTSASAVASVSQSGLVTAVGAGSATITATAGGQSGTAAITVAVIPTNPYGPVVDQKDIGPAGGTVGNGDVAVTIPAGALLSARTVQLVQDTAVEDPLSTLRTGNRVVVTGLPSGQTVPVRVRFRAAPSGSGVAAVALERPGVSRADSVVNELVYALHRATDSSGWFVATVPVTGRVVSGLSAFGTVRVPATPRVAGAAVAAPDLALDGLLSLVLNLTNRQTPNGRFDVWGFNNLSPTMPQKVERTVTLLEQAYTKAVTDLGYSVAHRATWPMQVYVTTLPGANGMFSNVGPYPWNQNLSTIKYRQDFTEDAEYPGVVIHELHHFLQEGFLLGKTLSGYAASDWISEATSTWVAELHPSATAPYLNGTALFRKDSLYGGLANNLVARSGYGKAPIMKYVAKRWGNDKVKDVWSAVLGGADPVVALVNTLPEAPRLWWPDLLYQHFGGSLYPWTVQQMFPNVGYLTPLRPGRRAYGAHTSPLKPLQVIPHRLDRDTALFGPNFQLPVFLDSSQFGKARLLVIEKPAAATHFRPIAGGDTVFIPGRRLQTRDSIVLLVTNTDVSAPLTARDLAFRVDLQLPQGDWYATSASNLVDNFRFTCDSPGDSTRIDAKENVVDVLEMFGTSGTWKRKATPSVPATYEWSVSPARADSIAALGLTLESTIRESAGDTVYLSARLRWDLLGDPSVSTLRARLLKGDLGGWWWWLLPLGLIPVARSKRTRRALPLGGIALLLLMSACVGFIGFDIDETIELQFTKLRYEADPANPNSRLMELREGTGKTVLNKYRSEVWVYTVDPYGAKTDSTRRVCTGTGNATYSVAGVVYADGVAPPELDDDDDDEPFAALAERALDLPGLAQKVREARSIRP